MIQEDGHNPQAICFVSLSLDRFPLRVVPSDPPQAGWPVAIDRRLVPLPIARGVVRP